MTREEAINKIKSWSLNQDDMEVLSVAIPELKESEDERIRKAIITYLSNELHNVKQLTPCTNEFEDWIAYLEKQKEQKTLSTEETKLNSIPSLEQLGYTCVPHGVKQKPTLKFKVGDKVHLEGDEINILTITGIEEDRYLTDSAYGPILFRDEDMWQIAEQKPVTNDGQQECPHKDLALVKDFFGKYKRKCRLSNKACDPKECEQWNKLQADFRNINEAFETGKKEVVAHPEKYGLCRSAGWSEEDKKQFNIVLDSLRYAYEDLNNNKSFDTANVVKKAFDWMQYCFKSLHPQKLDASKLENFDPVDVLNRIKTEWPMAWDKVVPKQEWSEEDRDNLERVDNYLWMLDDYVGDDCAMPQGKTDKIRGNIQGILSSWLKSLPDRFNLQPKQEWTEEDKRNIDRAVFYVCYYQRTNGNTDGSKECIDWLKSLRPIWKPSNEQMHYLKKVYDSYDFCDGERNALESLYEQLEKLM